MRRDEPAERPVDPVRKGRPDECAHQVFESKFTFPPIFRRLGGAGREGEIGEGG